MLKFLSCLTLLLSNLNTCFSHIDNVPTIEENIYPQFVWYVEKSFTQKDLIVVVEAYLYENNNHLVHVEAYNLKKFSYDAINEYCTGTMIYKNGSYYITTIDKGYYE